jgi:MYXO-CTERM domain-containing protein
LGGRASGFRAFLDRWEGIPEHRRVGRFTFPSLDLQESIMRFVALALFVMVPAAALASHPVVPTLLRQEANGAALPPGAFLATGETVNLYATSGSGSCGSGTYFLEAELQLVSLPFTGTPTHSSSMLKPSCVALEYPPVVVSNLAPGDYKWQVRERITTSSAWAIFNAGNTAFTIAPPNVPDILIDSVTLNMNPSPPANSLEFTTTGLFRNRGAVSTGPFQWRVWLSTTPTISSQSSVIWTSTTAINLDAAGTAGESASVTSGTILLNPRPPPGAYYVLIEADPHPTAGCTQMCGDVHEFDELNNVRSTASYFINGVDLVATSITNGPATAQPGNTFNLAVSFFNQGADPVVDAQGNLRPVTFRIVASRTGTITAQDQVVFWNTVTFAGGQTHNLTIPITLPPGILGGPVTWGLILDPLNEVIEALENNNTASSAAQTTIQQADLEAVSMDLVDLFSGVSTRTGDFGQQARFRVTMKNVGNYAAIPTHVSVILSKDNSLSLIADQRIEPDVAVPALGIGLTATHDVVVTLPTKDKANNDLATGDYFFFVQLDSFNAIHEVNESNNVLSSAAAVGPVRLRTPQQDYAVIKVNTSATGAGGDALFIERQLRNVGTSAGQPTDYACYASANAIITPFDFALPFLNADGTTVARRPVTLAAGALDNKTELVRVPGHIPAGSFFIGCVVDPDNALSELSKANNAAATATPVAFSAQKFQVATLNLPDGTLGQPYMVRLGTTGALSAVTWTPATPAPGLALSATGELAGTPNEHGVFTFTAFAHSGGFTAQRTLTVRVIPPTSELAITTDNLPPVINSTSLTYQAQLSAVGGTKPYAWALVGGTLPNGLTLDPQTGIIGGILKPGVANGETTITIRLRGALGSEVTRQLKIRVLPPGSLAIFSLGLSDGMVGREYLTDLAAVMAGGLTLSPPLQWSVVSGTLPPGLKLETHVDNATGLVSGTPTLAGAYDFTVQVSDALGRVDTAAYIVVIHTNALKVSWAEPPPVLRPGEPVALGVTATGTGGATFRLFSGTLPEGLELSADGKITGTLPEDAAQGTFNFAVGAEDAMGARGIGAFAVEVRSPPVAVGCSSAGGGPTGLLAFIALAFLGLLRVRRRPVRALAARPRR